jgi:hypothetical protein
LTPKNQIVALVLLLLLAGCTKKPENVTQAPEPPVHNTFTDYVDRGVTTMKKAEAVRDQSNAQTQQYNAQTQNVGEPQ